ncbi:MAG: porin family protein [Pyrinomonadaceae bacterium]|nr:porin family protein [Pyrinomonadaceae bacterium]
MRKTLILASTAIALTLASMRVSAQSEPTKVELGGHFTSITIPDFGGRSEAGFGGRVTFNFNQNVAIEAEGNFFPNNCYSCRAENVGTLAQGFFGVKAGKRFRKFGIFGKARPGFASFSGGDFNIILQPSPPGVFPFFIVNRSRATNFAFDLGAVVELYHSRRVFTRFDAGDTMIRYPQRSFNGLNLDPFTGTVLPFPITFPGETKHNFQFSAGVGIRF